jgi:hypothetical protein
MIACGETPSGVKILPRGCFSAIECIIVTEQCFQGLLFQITNTTSSTVQLHTKEGMCLPLFNQHEYEAKFHCLFLIQDSDFEV